MGLGIVWQPDQAVIVFLAAIFETALCYSSGKCVNILDNPQQMW